MDRPSGWFALPLAVRAAIGAILGAAYLVLLGASSVMLAGAGDGTLLPFALTSPFGLAGLITWPLVGALVASGGRGCRVAMIVLAVHYACGLVYYWWSPAGHTALDLDYPYLWLFVAPFTLGQLLIWFLAWRWGRRRAHG